MTSLLLSTSSPLLLVMIIVDQTAACVPSKSPPEWEMFRDYSDYDNYESEVGQGFEGAFQTVGTTTQAVTVSPGRYCGRNQYKSYGSVPYQSSFDAADNEMPWHVLLTITNSVTNAKTWCSAVVLTERWLLTTASCGMKAKNVNGATMTAFFGLNQQRNQEAPTNMVITTIITHPKYVQSTYQYDIALLQLPKSLSAGFPTWDIQRICLPETCSASCFLNVTADSGNVLTASGWGHSIDEPNDQSQLNLQKFDVHLIEMNTCQLARPSRPSDVAFTSVTADSMICAGNDEAAGLCQGDTGGPIMCLNRDGHYELAGITLFGQNCPRSQRYGTYTKLCDKNYDEILGNFIRRYI